MFRKGMSAIWGRYQMAKRDSRGIERGDMNKALVALIGGMLFFVIGLAISPTIISSAVTAATTTGIGSFAGVASVTGLVPLVFTFGLILGGLGLTVGGGFGLAGKGPFSD